VYGATVKKRRVFPELDEDLRTDFDFRHQLYPNHHTGTSILTELNIDMIKNFPLDYMHLILLGVTRTLLTFWVTGVKTGPKKLSPDKIVALEENLTNVLKSQPDDFGRRIRSTFQLKFWKATELRTFLLYAGPAVLENVLPSREFNHFLKLHCAVQIMLREERLVFIDTAETFLKDFVSEMLLVENPLYGNQFVGYNFHNLTHLANDVRNYGKLDNFSTFAFENRLFFLKRRLRSANLPLEQIINRLREHKAFRRNSTSGSAVYPRPSRPSSKGFNKIEVRADLELDTSHKNKYFLANTNEYLIFSHATIIDDTFLVHGFEILELQNLYEDKINFDSRQINICKTRSDQISDTLTTLKTDEIKAKVFGITINSHLYLFPL
jgi:hypothetical protein